MAKRESKKDIKYEDALDRLENIISLLQDGNLSLDESLDIFQEGVELVRVCQSKLDNAETKINMLIKNCSGNLKEVPFNPESEK